MDRKSTEEVMGMLGSQGTMDKLARANGLRWCGHVLRTEYGWFPEKGVGLGRRRKRRWKKFQLRITFRVVAEVISSCQKSSEASASLRTKSSQTIKQTNLHFGGWLFGHIIWNQSLWSRGMCQWATLGHRTALWSPGWDVQEKLRIRFYWTMAGNRVSSSADAVVTC